MTDFLDSLDAQPTEQDLAEALPLVLSELANENHLIKQELLRQSQDLHELRLQIAGALYLLQQTVGQDKYVALVGEFNALVADKLKTPVAGDEVS